MLQSTNVDRHYITGQVLKYRAAISKTQQRDCLWRIASNADLFSLNDLHSRQGLTDAQYEQVLQWLRNQNFKV